MKSISLIPSSCKTLKLREWNINKSLYKDTIQTLDATAVNVVRYKIKETLEHLGYVVKTATGALTKMNRISLNLSKTHYYDACCVGFVNDLVFKTRSVLQVNARGRGNRSCTNLNKHGSVRGYISRQKYYYGFQTGDMVKVVVPKGKYQGMYYGTLACRKSGCFDLKNKQGKRIIQGVNHKYFSIIQRFNGYNYFTEVLHSSHG